MLAAFREVERIDKAQALERLIGSRQFVIGVLDVERGNVIGHQHYFIGEKLLAVHARQVAFRDAAQQVHNEVAGAGTRVDDENVGARKAFSKFLFQNLDDARAHEVHDGLWRIDNAHRVSHLHRVALEEALIDAVEEVLLLAEVGQYPRRTFNGDVEAVQPLEIVRAIEALAQERVNHALDFLRDGVAPGEFGIVKDGAEQPLGQQVLHQHLIHRFHAYVGVERCLAELEELGEGLNEAGVVLVRLANLFRQAARQLRHALLEFFDRLFKTFDVRFGVAKELVQEPGKLLGITQRNTQDLLLVLVQDACLRVFEDGVRKPVAASNLAADFGVEIVLSVLGFPVAARQAVGVA